MAQVTWTPVLNNNGEYPIYWANFTDYCYKLYLAYPDGGWVKTLMQEISRYNASGTTNPNGTLTLVFNSENDFLQFQLTWI